MRGAVVRRVVRNVWATDRATARKLWEHRLPGHGRRRARTPPIASRPAPEAAGAGPTPGRHSTGHGGLARPDTVRTRGAGPPGARAADMRADPGRHRRLRLCSPGELRRTTRLDPRRARVRRGMRSPPAPPRAAPPCWSPCCVRRPPRSVGPAPTVVEDSVSTLKPGGYALHLPSSTSSDSDLVYRPISSSFAVTTSRRSPAYRARQGQGRCRRRPTSTRRIEGEPGRARSAPFGGVEARALEPPRPPRRHGDDARSRWMTSLANRGSAGSTVPGSATAPNPRTSRSAWTVGLSPARHGQTPRPIRLMARGCR